MNGQVSPQFCPVIFIGFPPGLIRYGSEAREFRKIYTIRTLHDLLSNNNKST